jgi:hypothetical protein
LEESRSREAALKEELKRWTEDLKCELEKKNAIIEEMKQQNERVLMEKNGNINRLENGRIFNFVCELVLYTARLHMPFRSEVHNEQSCQH